jgi:hypothetical protein
VITKLEIIIFVQSINCFEIKEKPSLIFTKWFMFNDINDPANQVDAAIM